mmetsp:Transcript_3968/g.8994  ORF Transcript_3968/g.8994 Transcript_3968/m.8994 type:complete len:172 (-) Transcript_3968:224-739(-)
MWPFADPHFCLHMLYSLLANQEPPRMRWRWGSSRPVILVVTSRNSTRHEDDRKVHPIIQQVILVQEGTTPTQKRCFEQKRAEREEADFMRQFPSLQIKKDYYSSWFAVDEATMCPKSLVKMDHVMGGNDDKKRERIKSEEPTVRILDKFHCRFCSNDKKWIIQRHLSERDT